MHAKNNSLSEATRSLSQRPLSKQVGVDHKNRPKPDFMSARRPPGRRAIGCLYTSAELMSTPFSKISMRVQNTIDAWSNPPDDYSRDQRPAARPGAVLRVTTASSATARRSVDAASVHARQQHAQPPLRGAGRAPAVAEAALAWAPADRRHLLLLPWGQAGDRQ